MNKQMLIHAHTLDRASIYHKIDDMLPKYLDAIEARNDTKPGTQKHIDAVNVAEHIEQTASRLVFNDDKHSFTECLDEIELMNVHYYVEKDVFMAGAGRPISITKGTPAYRHNGGSYYVLGFRKRNDVLTTWHINVPEHVVKVYVAG